jgi:hypothetical protein
MLLLLSESLKWLEKCPEVLLNMEAAEDGYFQRRWTSEAFLPSLCGRKVCLFVMSLKYLLAIFQKVLFLHKDELFSSYVTIGSNIPAPALMQLASSGE